MSQIIELLKNINYQVSKELLFNYKKLNITDSELIVLIYLINQSNNTYNPKQIGNDLKLDLNNVLELINSLCEKNIIKIDRSRRAIVRGLWKYLSDIMNSDKYQTSVLSIGDGVAITRKTGGN